MYYCTYYVSPTIHCLLIAYCLPWMHICLAIMDMGPGSGPKAPKLQVAEGPGAARQGATAAAVRPGAIHQGAWREGGARTVLGHRRRRRCGARGEGGKRRRGRAGHKLGRGHTQRVDKAPTD